MTRTKGAAVRVLGCLQGAHYVLGYSQVTSTQQHLDRKKVEEERRNTKGGRVRETSPKVG